MSTDRVTRLIQFCFECFKNGHDNMSVTIYGSIRVELICLGRAVTWTIDESGMGKLNPPYDHFYTKLYNVPYDGVVPIGLVIWMLSHIKDVSSVSMEIFIKLICDEHNHSHVLNNIMSDDKFILYMNSVSDEFIYNMFVGFTHSNSTLSDVKCINVYIHRYLNEITHIILDSDAGSLTLRKTSLRVTRRRYVQQDAIPIAVSIIQKGISRYIQSPKSYNVVVLILGELKL